MVISSMIPCSCLASNAFAILRAIHLVEYYLVFEFVNNRSIKPVGIVYLFLLLVKGD
jgi:hypothetical protein